MNQAPYSIKGFDHCEFYVGNAKQTAYFYNRTMGFNTIAYRGLETGSREKVSYVLNQGKIFLVVTSPMIKDTEIGHHIDRHGDGIKDVALTVDDAEIAWKSCIERGAKSAMSPLEVKDENGQAVMASIHTFGETIHTFIERNNYKGSFLPGYSEYSFESETCGLAHIDHVVGNQPDGEMQTICDFYEKVFGWHRFWTVDDCVPFISQPGQLARRSTLGYRGLCYVLFCSCFGVASRITWHHVDSIGVASIMVVVGSDVYRDWVAAAYSRFARLVEGYRCGIVAGTSPRRCPSF